MRAVKTGTVSALCALMLLVALLPGCKSKTGEGAELSTAAVSAESATTLAFVMLTDPEASAVTTAATATTTAKTTAATTAKTTAATTTAKPTTSAAAATTTLPSTVAASTPAPTAAQAPSTAQASAAASTALPAPKPDSAAENALVYRAEITQVLDLVNEHRARYGIGRLELDESLTLAACIRAREMAARGDISHTRPNGTSCFTVFDQVGVKCSTCGENIACGQSSPADVFNAWRASPGHNRNMLDGDYKKIGVGVAVDSQGRIYWVQLFAQSVTPVAQESSATEQA